MIQRRAPRTPQRAPAACSDGQPPRAGCVTDGPRPVPTSPAGVRLVQRAAALALTLSTAASGCWSGEWRAGAEVPIATTARLLPTRTIESWELLPTQTPYVLQVKGTSTPRCRH